MNNVPKPETNKEKLDRILFYLEDDPTTGRIGIAHAMQNIDKRVESLEGDRRIVKGVSVVFGIIGSIIGWLGYETLTGWKK